MNIKLIIGIIILIICCVLAFLISKFWINNCKGGICPAPIERKANDMLDWLTGLAWYFKAVIVGVIGYLIYYFGFK